MATTYERRNYERTAWTIVTSHLGQLRSLLCDKIHGNAFSCNFQPPCRQAYREVMVHKQTSDARVHTFKRLHENYRCLYRNNQASLLSVQCTVKANFPGNHQYVCVSVDVFVCPVHCVKTADRIRMPFSMVGRKGPWMMYVTGFGDRSTGNGNFGGRSGAPHCNQWDFLLLGIIIAWRGPCVCVYVMV